MKSTQVAALIVQSVESAVMIAMAVVQVVQVPRDQVIHMVAMRQGRVAARWIVTVACVVTGAGVSIRALRGIPCVYADPAFVRMPVMQVMQVAIMQIVDVPLVLDRPVSTGQPVSMSM